MPNEQEVGLAERIGKFINSSPQTAMLLFMAWWIIRVDNQKQELIKTVTVLSNDQLNMLKETKSSELKLKEKELEYKYKYPNNDTQK